MKLFGSSGIRDVVDKNLLQLMFEIGLATGNLYASAVVGSDTRTSSDAMKYAFLSGFLAAGGAASDSGVVPTPTLAYAARHFEAGAMITASHNPPEYNGIKLVNPDGSAFDPCQRENIEKMLSFKSFKLAPWEKMKGCTNYSSAIEEHIQRILADLPPRLKLKVAVDCGCGAASAITPQLLQRLGCKVIPLNCQPSGHFPREIEPVPENLGDLMRAVKSESADFGIAHDGDADRVVIIDDEGRYVSGDKLTALLAQHLGAEKVVTTVDASMSIEEMGFQVVRTRVGDAFVSDELRANTKRNAKEFGAEPSGCFIFPKISLCPDGIYAAATIAQIASERRLSSLIDRIPSYPILRGSVQAHRAIMKYIERRLRGELRGQLTTIDGLKLTFNDGWLLIRPSGTERKIRLTAEAKNKRRVREIYELGLRIVSDAISGGETVES